VGWGGLLLVVAMAQHADTFEAVLAGSCKAFDVVELAVPLDVDTAFGPTWFDAQKH
jgi:hypothetical protein